MPITVYYQNKPDAPCTIRPAPFVAISEQILKNKEGRFGSTYVITLTGTLLANQGLPYAMTPSSNGTNPFPIEAGSSGPTPCGPYRQFDSTPISIMPIPPRQQLVDGPSNISQNTKPEVALLSKQRAIRALFANDGQRVEITDLLGNTGATITCFPRTISVDFTEGQYITKCEFTIVLEADYLLRGTFDPHSQLVDYEGTFALPSGLELRDENLTVGTMLRAMEASGAFIESFSEDWGIEVDDQQGESVENPMTYRITRNLSATGKTTFHPDMTGFDPQLVHNQWNSVKVPAWLQAKRFVDGRLADSPSGQYNGYPNVYNMLGSGTINLVSGYGGFNHIRTEQINVSEGTYSVTENWVLSSGQSHESYNMSVSTSNSDPFVTVQIDGNIKGLRSIPMSGFYGPNAAKDVAQSGAWANALAKYNLVSNSGKFGLTSDIYKRANNMVAVALNSQPVSTSIGANQYTGELTYSLSFNNRPTNIISGVVAESIQVNDTYPGDIFATIPVIGRATGPILQYIGGRSEYKRDVSINLTMDYTKIPYGKTRDTLILKKPSLVEPTASQIASLIKELSPNGEPGVRKWFVNAPSESWSPKEGTYSFNISWTYELDR